MSLTSHRLVTSLLVACVTTVAFAVPLSPSANAAQARVVVAGASAVPHADRVVSTPITASFDVVLALKDPTGLSRFLADLTTPGSPLYRHFLTPSEFGALYGASDATVSQVRHYLQGYGLSVRSLNSAHSLLAMTGSTRDIARAFATPVETVRMSDGSLRAQFARSATLPLALAREVTAVAGLSSVLSPESHLALASSSVHTAAVARSATRAAATTPRAKAHVALPATCAGAVTATSNDNAFGSFTVQQQAQLYGLNNAWTAGHTGAGQTIAIYELMAHNTSDLSTFLSCYGLSPTLTTINVDNGTTGGFSDEATLDVEEEAALAPGAALEIYQTSNTAADPVDLYARIASDDTASIVTTSWGDCEIDPTGSVAAEQVIFEQMAAQGQTVVAAAGDLGSSDCNGVTTNAAAVDDPASQPYVTGVGGLTVNSISPLSQTVWNSGGGASGGASGGGVSQIWSRPSWQNAPGISTATDTMRMVPDLSVMGDPNTGFIQYYTDTTQSCQGWCSIGGTSIGAPLVSALIATAAQTCNTSRLGFLNPTLYSLARSSTGFVDVTSGSNDLFGIGEYSAAVGYDLASGLGSPNTTFINDLCPTPVDLARSSLVATSAASYATTASHFSVALRDANGNPVIDSSVTVIAKGQRGVVSIDADPSSIKSHANALDTITSDTTGNANFTLTSTVPQSVSLTVKLGGVELATNSVTFQALPLTRKKPSTPTVTRVEARHRAALIVVAPRAASSPFVVAIQVSVDGGRTWHSYPGRATSILVADLKGRTTYVLRLRARNANGVSASSRSFRVTTLN